MSPVISADGSRIVFLSTASNLTEDNDQGPLLNVFTFAVASDEMRLVSRSRFGARGGNGNSAFPSVSPNGDWIVYSSEAEDLVAGDTNLLSDIFVYHLPSGSNILLSTSLSGHTALGRPNDPPIAGSVRPVMSADARWVVFESSATNMAANDDGWFSDLFLRDVLANGPINVNGTNTTPASYVGGTFACSITPDGKRAVYLARENNTVGVFVRDFTTGARISCSARLTNLYASASHAYYRCYHPLISEDGNTVVYKATRDPAPTNAMLFRYQIDTDTLTGIATNTPIETPPAMSRDGRFVAFDWFTNVYAASQVFVWDALTGSRQLVSVNETGTAPAAGPSESPAMSADGRFIAFLSAATNITASSKHAKKYQLYLRDLANGITRLISFNTNGIPCAQGTRHAVPSLSADGFRMVFDYTGGDMVRDDYNESSDAFLYEWEHDRLRLVSRSNELRPATTSALGLTAELHSTSADGRSVAFTRYAPGSRDGWVYDSSQQITVPLGTNIVQPLLSGNGRYVVFLQQVQARLPNYVIGETNHLFRMDLLSGNIEPVDADPLVRTNSLLKSRRFGLAISANGRLVLYEKTNQLYLRDMITASNHLVTVSSLGTASTGACWYPLLNPDERRIVFQSTRQLTAEPIQPGSANVYARDLLSQQTFLVSKGVSSIATPVCFDATGRFLAFEGYQGSLYPGPGIYLFDFASNSHRLICEDCVRPGLSGDASLAVYIKLATSSRNLVLHNLLNGTELLISSNPAIYIPRYRVNSPEPFITPDGRFVVFTTPADDIEWGDFNKVRDIYVRDRYTAKTMLMSRGTVAADGVSGRPLLSADGRTLIFQSFAQFAEDDQNHALDLFSIQLGAGDSDRDGMDDNWEMTFFSTLDRTGAEDYDRDGHSDLTEFMSGTDPTNSESVFEVMIIRSLQSSYLTLRWPRLEGRQYVVQFKPRLDGAAWQNASGVLPDYQNIFSITPAASREGYYRLLLVQ